jgi:3-dehydroquinate synthase
MKEIRCKLGRRSYSVFVGKGLLKKISARLRALEVKGKVCVVTNKRVGSLYGKPLEQALKKNCSSVIVHYVPDSETAKSEKELFRLYERLVRGGCDRSGTIIALGGGVVGDLSGFCAATFMRGIAFINIPTTLLAQVDSAIGGKTGINLPSGKNLVGAFYQPRCVISDVAVLGSLSKRQRADSLSEVIKYGVIWDKRFFSFLEDAIEDALAGDLDVLEEIVAVSAQIKSKIVERDERETTGLRAILNYGHTFAHAFESFGAYTKITHGRAVGLGMIAAARCAVICRSLSAEDAYRIELLLMKSGIVPAVKKYFGSGVQPKRFVDAIYQLMKGDKKNKGQKITLILPRSIGTVDVRDDIKEKDIKKALYSLVTP